MLTRPKAEDLRETLIVAADQLLRTQGIAALTTRDIARAAGCSEGALYTHFAGKSELLLAVCQERLPDLRGMIGDLVGRVGSGSVERNLEAIIRSTQDFMRELVPLTNAVASDQELRTRHREAFADTLSPPRRTLEALAAYIAAEQRIGRVDAAVPAQVYASMLIGACYAAASAEYVFGEPPHGMTSEKYARALARALWRGMAPREERAE